MVIGLTKLKNQFVLGLMVASLLAPAAHADTEMKEFLMSCTYGVLAGTLVGAALLAFTDQPGENLSKVARGASIGLYTGIALGLYVVYGIDEKEEDPDMLNGPSGHWRGRQHKQPLWALAPTLHEGRLDGAALVGEVFRF
jgi:hypothetical protein